MPDIGFDFGSGLQASPETPDGSGVPTTAPSGDLVPAPASAATGPGLFGSGLFGRSAQIYANRPQLDSTNPVQDRANALSTERQRLQGFINNPLRAFLKPDEYRQDIESAAKIDSEIMQSQQAIQNQRDLREGAANAGLSAPRVNALGATATDKTLLNAWTGDYSEGSFAAAKVLGGMGEVGQGVLSQHQGDFMPALAQRNEQAQGVIDSLNNAAAAGQTAYEATLQQMKQQGIDPSKVISNYIPNFVVPDKADAWQVRGRGAQGTLMQAKQMVSQYNTKQAALGLSEPVNDEKEANAAQGTLFKGSTGAPIEGGNTVKLPNGEYGSSLPAGSRVPQNYMKPNGEGKWSNSNNPAIDIFNKQVGTPEVKGTVDQYNSAKKFNAAVNDPKMVSSAAGTALISDELGGIGRDLAEGSKASGTVGLTKMLDQKYGSVGNFLNKATTNWSEFSAWMDSGKKGPAPELKPRLTPEAIQGLKEVGAFKYNESLNEVKQRVAQPLFTAGRLGIPLKRTGLDETLQNDPAIQGMAEEGRQSYIKDITSHPAVFEGDTRIMLRQGTTNPDAAKTPPVKDALPADANADRYAKTLIQVESGGKTGQQTGSYKGLAQFSDAELAAHGIKNPDDRAQVEDAVKRDYVTNKSAIQRATGIVPTDTQVYLAHQQGLGGIEAHMKNPDAPAWQNMASTAEGQRKGADWAKQAVWGNVPDDMKNVLAKNGVNADNLTSKDFMNLWTAKFEHVAGSLPSSGAQAMSRMRGALTQPAMKTAALTAAEAAPAAGALGGAVIGSAGGPVGTVAGGAGGSAVGQVVKNYMQGNDISQGVGKSAAMGAAQSIPVAGPVIGTAIRGLAAGAVGAGSEAIENPEAMPSEILKAGVETGAAQAGGEGFFRLVGLAGGKAMNMIYSKFTQPTQQELAKAGEVIAAGKPEAPKGIAGQPASDTAKVAHEDAVQTYEDAVQTAKNHGIDPEHLAYAVTQAKAGTSAGTATVNAVAAREQARLGKEYEGVKQDVGAAQNKAGTPPPASGMVRYYHGASPGVNPTEYNAWLTPSQDYARDYRGGPNAVHYVDVTPEQAAAQGGIDEVNGNRPRIFQANAATSAQLKPFSTGQNLGTPKQAPLTNGPLSMVGKPASQGGVPQEFMGRATEAENNITAPAKNWGEKYQQLFDERSKLLEEARAADGGAAPDPNKARNLNALADNVEKHQEAAMMYIFGPKRGPAVIAKLQQTHRDYATLMEATKGTGNDIISGMAQNGAKGASARAAFQKYAADDPLAQKMADVLSSDKMQNARKEGVGSRLGKLAVTWAAHALGIHPVLASIAVTEGPKLLNEFTSRRGAGGPVTMAQLIRRKVARMTPQDKQRAAALAGRMSTETVQ